MRLKYIVAKKLIEKKDGVWRMAYGREIVTTTTLTYHWEGDLHHPRTGIRSALNFRRTLEDLAENLAFNLKGHPSLQHDKAGVPAYIDNSMVYMT